MTDYYPYQYEPQQAYPPAQQHDQSQQYSQYPPPVAPPPASPRKRSLALGFGSGLVAAALVVAGIALVRPGAASTIAGAGSLRSGLNGGSGSSGQTLNPNGSGNGGSGSSGSGSGSGSTSKGTATAAQQIGIVTIVSTLKYQNAQSAGTGMILSSSGEVLTNNHVINGATSIVVTVETTGTSYKADVVGTSPTNDVAVIKLVGASGLQTAALASTAKNVQVGDAVTGVGNAGGTGTLAAASGQVTALNQSITATDETGASSEKLTGLIEVNANIISGDSGGPLYNAAGKIIGMDTAASANRTSAAASAYAITIDHATDIANQIESGNATTSIHLGLPGFLGVSTQAANGAGAGVASLLDGGPAASAGITSGSVITGIDGTAVTSPTSLRAALAGKKPGAKVSVSWTDSTGQSRTATVTLGTGPAD